MNGRHITPACQAAYKQPFADGHQRVLSGLSPPSHHTNHFRPQQSCYAVRKFLAAHLPELLCLPMLGATAFGVNIAGLVFAGGFVQVIL